MKRAAKKTLLRKKGRPLAFTYDYVERAIDLRNLGFTLKFVACRLGFHRDTITIHLRAHLDRLAPWAFRRKPPRPSEAERVSVAIAALKGSHRLHAAHAVLDLHELMRHVAPPGVAVALGARPRPVTLADLAYIRGACEGSTDDKGRPRATPQRLDATTRAFYRIQAMLKPFGIRFEKRMGEDGQQVLDFDAAELSAFVECEVRLAGRVIEDYARRSGESRRFRGRP